MTRTPGRTRALTLLGRVLTPLSCCWIRPVGIVAWLPVVHPSPVRSPQWPDASNQACGSEGSRAGEQGIMAPVMVSKVPAYQGTRILTSGGPSWAVLYPHLSPFLTRRPPPASHVTASGPSHPTEPERPRLEPWGSNRLKGSQGQTPSHRGLPCLAHLWWWIIPDPGGLTGSGEGKAWVLDLR